MRTRIPVLLVDDGELEDVHELLETIGVEYALLRGGAVPPELEPPSDLFVTTPRHASLCRSWPPHSGGAGRPVKLVIAEEDSETLRKQLRRMGYDCLVRRPVHPEALRLLVVRALYHGLERRREPRAVVGTTVSIRSRLRRRSALLTELSSSGCRLLVQGPVAEASTLSVRLPAELAGGTGLTLRGRVIRTAPAPSPTAEGPRSATRVAVRFEKLSAERRGRLEELVRSWTAAPPSGPVPSSAGSARRPTAEATCKEAHPPTPPPPERRRHRRVGYVRRILALEGEARRTLIGRDLSCEGMRIDRDPELALGTRLRLALYGRAGEPPIEVTAVVARDDGERGLALRFEDLAPDAGSRLEALVASLPSIEVLRFGEAGSLGTVLSKVVAR